MYLLNCQGLSRPNSKGVTLDGVVEWVNPFGHLDGSIAPLLPVRLLWNASNRFLVFICVDDHLDFGYYRMGDSVVEV